MIRASMSMSAFRESVQLAIAQARVEHAGKHGMPPLAHNTQGHVAKAALFDLGRSLECLASRYRRQPEDHDRIPLHLGRRSLQDGLSGHI
jgi:hypothetical protein